MGIVLVLIDLVLCIAKSMGGTIARRLSIPILLLLRSKHLVMYIIKCIMYSYCGDSTVVHSIFAT